MLTVLKIVKKIFGAFQNVVANNLWRKSLLAECLRAKNMCSTTLDEKLSYVYAI